MKKTIIFILVSCFFIKIGHSQLLKGNWLIGGNANLSSLRSSSQASLQYNQKNIQISPVIGYFLGDKFVAGLRPSFIYGSNSVGSATTIIGIGPLVRYYLLSPENMFNLFTEAGYSYGNIKSKGGGSGQKSNTFSISGGPVLYFNSSVGLEFTFSYSTTKVVGFSGKNNELKFGIGFMFYLEKKE